MRNNMTRMRFEFILTIISVHLFYVCGANTTLDNEIQIGTENNLFTTENILKIQRAKIAEEVQTLEYDKGFKHINALTPEANGNPFRNIIVTTWRSGSTFLGEILNSMPANYHFFEPLVNYGIQVIRGPPHDEQVIHQVKQQLHCNYTDLNDFVNFGAKHKFVHEYNTRLWNYCNLHPGHPNTTVANGHPDDPRYCSNASFLSSFCKLFPLQSMKILRLRLALVQSLLDDPSLNVRVLFLVRDPRALMLSRKSCKWCWGVRDCEHAPSVCSDMIADYDTARIFRIKYPQRFKVVRYEELSLNPFKMIEEILQFYGLTFNQKVVEFLETHTRQNIGNIYSTYRNSSSVPFRWRQKLTYDEIEDIQTGCSIAMELWGYKQMEPKDIENGAGFNPLLEWTF